MIRKLTLLVLCLMLVGISVVRAHEVTFVLVHGAFQDASGWDAVVSELEAEGHTAIAVELAGRGDDETPLSDITLNTYRDIVVDLIDKQTDPVILVGHSFGGMVISAVAEAVPERVATLVYLAAYLPRTGESLSALGAQDHFSVLGQEGNFLLADDFSTASINEEIFASAFCPDCDEEQAELVAASQLAEPLIPLNEPVTLTEENFGSVNKVYILTAQDIIVSPQLQALMLANTPVDHVYALDAGHAAYITAPDALAELLIEAAHEEE